MSGYRLDNFQFVAADPETRPKRTGPGGRVPNIAAAAALYEIVKDGSDATDDKAYKSESEARSVSQSAARLLKLGITHNKMDDQFTASTRVWPEDGKWHWRVFLKEVKPDEIPVAKE